MFLFVGTSGKKKRYKMISFEAICNYWFNPFGIWLGGLRWESIDFSVICVSHSSRVRLFVTPWTVACQAPLSMGFSRQEYWSGLPCPPPGDLPDPGIKPKSILNCRQTLYQLSHQGSPFWFMGPPLKRGYPQCWHKRSKGKGGVM